MTLKMLLAAAVAVAVAVGFVLPTPHRADGRSQIELMELGRG